MNRPAVKGRRRQLGGPRRVTGRVWLLPWLGLAACVPPCPDTYPLCIEAGAAGCRAWSAQCCMGVVACAKDTTFADDAGSCSVVEIPEDKRVRCN